jgi:hypothetical protein
MQIIAALLVSLVASLAYCQLSQWVLTRWPTTRVPITVFSWPISLLTVLCILLPLWPGAKFLASDFSASYRALYAVSFMGGPPALANLLLVRGLKKEQKPTQVLRQSVLSCWAACAILIVGDWIVYRAVYGPA